MNLAIIMKGSTSLTIGANPFGQQSHEHEATDTLENAQAVEQPFRERCDRSRNPSQVIDGDE